MDIATAVIVTNNEVAGIAWRTEYYQMTRHTQQEAGLMMNGQDTSRTICEPPTLVTIH